jgi:SAM-dependent methyltransferase
MGLWNRRPKLTVDHLTLDVAYPGQPPKELRPKIFSGILDHLAGRGETFVDLGAGGCNFSIFARDRGYRVTAVDARAERVPDDRGSIEFVQSDIRDFDVSGYDIVCVLGLFYHLTLSDQLDLLTRCGSSLVILDTQLYEPERALPAEPARLSEVVDLDSYEGVHFRESENTFASWGNEFSFWHTGACQAF